MSTVVIRNDAYYQCLAESRLREAGIVEPPVSLTRVADHLGVPVCEAVLPPFFGAAIVNEDGLPTILLNTALGEADRRRALGHVIGHLLQVSDEPGAQYPRDAGEHREADLIGVTLVMPDSLVVGQARKWFNDYRYLAGLFGVGEDEMLDKMVDMGLVRHRGVRWDY
jgi:hypothetical protein